MKAFAFAFAFCVSMLLCQPTSGHGVSGPQQLWMESVCRGQRIALANEQPKSHQDAQDMRAYRAWLQINSGLFRRFGVARTPRTVPRH